MGIKETYADCICGHRLDTSDHAPRVICRRCKRVYARQPAKLFLLDTQEESYLPGVVIIQNLNSPHNTGQGVPARTYGDKGTLKPFIRRIKMFALCTDQGTAASETFLCNTCYTILANRNYAREQAAQSDDTDPTSKFVDCTANDASDCCICGDFDPDSQFVNQEKQDKKSAL